MARRPQSRAAPKAAAPAAPNAQAAAVTSPEVAAETSEGGADTTVSVDAAGSGLPQAAEGADSVSTSASSEAASSLQGDAASDTFIGTAGGDSLAVGAGGVSMGGGQGSDFFRDASKDWRDFGDTSLLGSNILPALIDLGNGEPLPLGELVVMAKGGSGLSAEAWNGLPEDLREEILDVMVTAMRGVAAAQVEIVRLVAPIDDSLVMVSAKTRHSRAMMRCGHLWTRTFRKQAVPPEVAARLRADPNLIVKDD